MPPPHNRINQISCRPKDVGGGLVWSTGSFLASSGVEEGRGGGLLFSCWFTLLSLRSKTEVDL